MPCAADRHASYKVHAAPSQPGRDEHGHAHDSGLARTQRARPDVKETPWAAPQAHLFRPRFLDGRTTGNQAPVRKRAGGLLTVVKEGHPRVPLQMPDITVSTRAPMPACDDPAPEA